MSKMLPKRPYLLRAMHQWITECGNTPHVIVDAGRDSTDVPRAYVKDGKIVLNLSEGATQRLRLGNHAIEFDARFAGVIHHVRFPVSAVRSEEHTSELQSQSNFVCRLLPEKKQLKATSYMAV